MGVKYLYERPLIYFLAQIKLKSPVNIKKYSTTAWFLKRSAKELRNLTVPRYVLKVNPFKNPLVTVLVHFA